MRTLAILAGAAALVAPAAHADEYHYRNVLIGERAAGLGGAYVAVSDDPTGIFYNPAGLVFSFENYISISANTYTTSETRFKGVAGGQDYVLRSQGLIPSFFGFSQSIGKQKFAFGIAVPNADLLDQSDVLENIQSGTDALGTIRRRFFDQDTTYLFGPAWSRALGDRASIGISLLGFYRSGITIDDQLILLNPVPSGKYLNANTYTRFSTYGVNPILGAQWMASSSLSFGLSVSKKFRVNGSRDVRIQTGATSTSGSSTLPTTPSGNYDHDYGTTDVSEPFSTPSPWTYSLGAAYFPSKTVLISSQVDLYSSDKDSTAFAAQSTLNGAVGAELYLSENLATRLGAFTNRAASPAVLDGAANQATHTDLYGGSASLSLLRPGSSVTLGAIYSLGTGKGQEIGGSAAIQEVSQRSLSVYLSGSYQL